MITKKREEKNKMGQMKSLMCGKLFGSKPSFPCCHHQNKFKILSSVTVFSRLQKSISPHSFQNYYIGKKMRKQKKKIITVQSALTNIYLIAIVEFDHHRAFINKESQFCHQLMLVMKS